MREVTCKIMIGYGPNKKSCRVDTIVSFINITLIKYSKSWNVHVLELRDTSNIIFRSYHHWSYPNHWYPPPPQIILFPYIESNRNTTQPCLRVFIIEGPPKQHISSILRVIIIEVPQHRYHEYSTIPPPYYNHHEPWRSYWIYNVCSPCIRHPPYCYINIKCF